MNEIDKPQNRTHYAAYSDAALHIGVVEIDQVLSTGQPNLIFDTDAKAFASKVKKAKLIARLPKLPAEGEEVAKDEVYQHSGKVVIVLEAHTRSADIPSNLPQLFSVV